MTAGPPWEGALRRLERVLERAESLFPKREPAPDPAIFETHRAFRWERNGDSGRIVPVDHPHRVDLEELVGIDRAEECGPGSAPLEPAGRRTRIRDILIP